VFGLCVDNSNCEDTMKRAENQRNAPKNIEKRLSSAFDAFDAYVLSFIFFYCCPVKVF